MKRVTGVGGIFFKSESPKELMAWYREHLGLEPDTYGGWTFMWRDKDQPQRVGRTVFNPFKADTDYFEPATVPYMFNLRVDDLPALIEQLKREGVQVVGDVQEFPYGKFAWIVDPEGRKIELWQPPDEEIDAAE
jgi:predicted enzyme related to lactoylglutathione lyase